MISVSACPNCPTVPVVSLSVANQRLRRVPEEQRSALLVRAMEWLTQRHQGLETYAGIHGRHYTNEEKDAIALETGVVEGLPCPFWQNSECLLGGLGPHYNKREETGKAPYGWLPTLVALRYGREDYQSLVSRGYVADAKVALLSRNEGFLIRETVGSIP